MNPSPQKPPSGCPFSGTRRGGAPGSITLHPLANIPSPPARFSVDPATIATLSAGVALVNRHTDRLTRDFYHELFTTHPTLRALFPTDMSAQESKLAQMLQSVIEGLSNLQSTRASLAQLGAHHHALGVRKEHYPIVCNAFLTVMRRRGGPDWTPELDSEWSRALDLISALMLAGAENALTPPPSTAPPATPAPPANQPPPSIG